MRLKAVNVTSEVVHNLARRSWRKSGVGAKRGSKGLEGRIAVLAGKLLKQGKKATHLREPERMYVAWCAVRGCLLSYCVLISEGAVRQRVIT